MKNFLEATAIKSNLKLDIKIILEPVAGAVPCMVKISKAKVYEGMLDHPEEILHQISLTDAIDISIQINRQHPDAVIVTVVIDGYEIIPLYLNYATPPTNYIDSNDIWTFKIPNFYTWLHEVTGQGWIA